MEILRGYVFAISFLVLDQIAYSMNTAISKDKAPSLRAFALFITAVVLMNVLGMQNIPAPGDILLCGMMSMMIVMRFAHKEP